MLKKSKAMFATVAAALAFFIIATGDSGAAPAKGSGKVVVYAALNENDMVELKKKFKEDTGIDLEYMVFSAGEGSARVLAEAKAPQADVFVGGSVEVYAPLKDAGVLEKYVSPNAKDIPAEYRDPDGYFQGWYMGVQSLIYNRDRFGEEIAPKGVNPPKTPDDLLNPVYRELLVGSNPATAGGGYIFVANQIFTRGEKGAWEFIEKLNENIHHYTKGAGDVISLVAAGEFVASYAWAHDSFSSVKQGYPLEIVIPDKTAFEVGAAALIKGGANPGNAKIFMDWILTKEIGQLNTDLSNRYS
ncbi:MAG: extracellular solute-binding protein, partial [Deltaproteobacteria bacterium]|nr:extracellular solute-binding protein [Deltaproteobacteria bacterium]